MEEIAGEGVDGGVAVAVARRGAGAGVGLDHVEVVGGCVEAHVALHAGGVVHADDLDAAVELVPRHLIAVMDHRARCRAYA